MKKGQNIAFVNVLRVIGYSLLFLFAWVYLTSIKLSASDDVLNFYHYTKETGLPSSYVKGIAQDHYGFIWLATRVSVSRFDGSQYKEFPAFNEKGEQVELLCNRIFTCPDSTLVCRTNDGRYFRFDFENECFKAYTILNDIGLTQSLEPTNDGFWICRDNNVYFVDSKTGLLTDLRKMDGFSKIPGDISFVSLLVRGDQLVVLTGNKLIFLLDLKKKSVRSFEMPAVFENLPVSVFYLDHLNYLWLSEETCGLCRMDLSSGRFIHFSNDHSDKTYIPHNMVHCFTEDKQNHLWIGTEAGLFLWSNVSETFTFHKFEPNNPNGLNSDPIYSCLCDNIGNIWLGTYFGGINFWSSEKSFFKTWHSGISDWQLGGNVVSCLKEDSEGNLWIAFEDMGLNKYNIHTGEVIKYTSKSNSKCLTYNNLHDLLFVSDDELWIASYTGGINIMNPKTGNFTYINQRNNSELPSNNIYALYRLGNSIYIATSQGIAIYDLNYRRLSRFKPNMVGNLEFQSICKSGDKVWFSTVANVYYLDLKTDSFIRFEKIPQMSNINFVKADSKGRIWIGDCYNGLCYFDEKSDKVVFFNKENSFPASWMFSLEEGKNGWIWVSTDKGLVNFNPETKDYVLYDNTSGITFNQFNFRASYTDKHGNIYFGGNNGMVSFNEKENPKVLKNRPVIFTGLQLFNKPVQPGKNSPLKKSLNQVDEVVLRYDQNVFTIEYTAMSFSTYGRCQYAYYLENFEKNWNYVGNRAFATYTNLSPGTYYFHVKSSENSIMKQTDEQVLKIVVRPPYYLTVWAFIAYFLLICLISVIIYRIGKRLEKSKALVEMERREKEHGEEINKVKLEFFTNISHELKTPLTLILGPLSKLIEEEKLSPIFRKRLTGIDKNARRLFQLINQLLEFRKIENGKERLVVSQCDVRLLAEEIKESFESLTDSKDVDFRINIPQKETLVWIDANKIDKILFNLLSNAFKFTDDGGIVDLTIGVVRRDDRSRKSNQDLLISVSDTGKGIKPEMLDKVFDRFFQIEDGNIKHKGSGIGLAYVKSLVLLHHGKIEVESELSVGTKFTVTVPASIVDYSADEIVKGEPQVIEHEENIAVDTDFDPDIRMIDSNGTSRLPIVLIVEDNLELLDFMKESLEERYQIYSAQNGRDALEKLNHFSPELIISDVMMPEMDGFEFTRKIKSEINTSHIPVILLTAKSGIENKFRGLKTGADYYIEKPFYPAILEQNIENILNTRSNLIDRFKNDAFVPMSEIVHSESDKVFVEKLTAIIKSNISDPNMDVTFLITEMGMSRSLLHLKLKGLIDCSTTEFIRSVRLKEAVKLISSGKCNISEAAYETGFSSPAYFTRRFKEHYGKSPREYFDL
jgi:signal transduction histidine kinase/ligand-binding sensor domain-containing protein/AraC-like DNA-binding protein